MCICRALGIWQERFRPRLQRRPAAPFDLAAPAGQPGEEAADPLLYRRLAAQAQIAGCHCSRNRSICLTPITTPSQTPYRANPVPPQIYRIPCACRLGFGLELMQKHNANGATTYTDTGTSQATQYVYRVKAKNAHGVDPWANFARINK